MNDTEQTVSNSSWGWYRDAIRTWLEDPGGEELASFNLTSLKIDQAFVTGLSDKNVGVYFVSDDCFRVSTILNIFLPNFLLKSTHVYNKLIPIY